MPLDGFGSFPRSDWFDLFADDVRSAKRIRIASGFTDGRAARRLAEILPRTAEVEVLVSLAGCSGTDVLKALAGDNVRVRASRLSGFHWKLALVEQREMTVAYLGSANFTSKGLDGTGELMARIGGSRGEQRFCDELARQFDDYFQEGMTVSGVELERILTVIEEKNDALTAAHATVAGAVDDLIAEQLRVQLRSPRKAWLLVWNSYFSPAQSAQLDRVLGSLPTEAWSRGEVLAPSGKLICSGDIVLTYEEPTREYVLGRAVPKGQANVSGKNISVLDLEHIGPKVTADTALPAFAAVRQLVVGLEKFGCTSIEPIVFKQVVDLMRNAVPSARQ